MPKFNVTYETWTPTDVEYGETNDHGFIAEDVSLHEALRLIGDRACEANEWPIRAPRWFTNYEYNHNYRTGQTEQRSLHIPDNVTTASRLRIARLLGLEVNS